MIVKICGLMSMVDAIYANMAGPDWAGLVFHQGSRRCVSKETAASVRDMLGSGIRTVAVTVDRDVGFIRDLVSEGIVDMVQVHANADESYFRRVADLGVPTIRAYVVRSAEDVEKASSCEADYTMLDAGLGSGRTFDWSLLQDADFPYILSGGLDPHNVLDAVRRLDPAGVDVSSGVETDGAKDPTKMTAFVYAARGNFEPLLDHHRSQKHGHVDRDVRDPVFHDQILAVDDVNIAVQKFKNYVYDEFQKFKNYVYDEFHYPEAFSGKVRRLGFSQCSVL